MSVETEAPALVLDGQTIRLAEKPQLVEVAPGRFELRCRALPQPELITIRVGPTSTAIERGEEGAARAARRWTVEEAARVDEAIRTVARDAHLLGSRTADLSGSEFTTADVWAELGPDFPITKGIASKMTAAARAGIIRNTGRVIFNDHPRHAHAHGQRLAVWQATDTHRSTR